MDAVRSVTVSMAMHLSLPVFTCPAPLPSQSVLDGHIDVMVCHVVPEVHPGRGLRHADDTLEVTNLSGQRWKGEGKGEFRVGATYIVQYKHMKGTFTMQIRCRIFVQEWKKVHMHDPKHHQMRTCCAPKQLFCLAVSKIMFDQKKARFHSQALFPNPPPRACHACARPPGAELRRDGGYGRSPPLGGWGGSFAWRM